MTINLNFKVHGTIYFTLNTIGNIHMEKKHQW